mmetsp:Transcript_34514/g.88305  ORF Transcript_34514/g.88305 Transcript_34514/m.88305 type:complete len:255 (-) Transcript_34514:415-1179(-)
MLHLPHARCPSSGTLQVQLAPAMAAREAGLAPGRVKVASDAHPEVERAAGCVHAVGRRVVPAERAVEDRHLPQAAGRHVLKVPSAWPRLGLQRCPRGARVGQRQPEVELPGLVTVLQVAVRPAPLGARPGLQPHARRVLVPEGHARGLEAGSMAEQLCLESGAAHVPYERLVDGEDAKGVVRHSVVQRLPRLEVCKHSGRRHKFLQWARGTGRQGRGREAPRCGCGCQQRRGGLRKRVGGGVKAEGAGCAHAGR